MYVPRATARGRTGPGLPLSVCTIKYLVNSRYAPKKNVPPEFFYRISFLLLLPLHAPLQQKVARELK